MSTEFCNQRDSTDPVAKACRVTLSTLRLEVIGNFLEQISSKGVEEKATKSDTKKPPKPDNSMNFLLFMNVVCSEWELDLTQNTPCTKNTPCTITLCWCRKEGEKASSTIS